MEGSKIKKRKYSRLGCAECKRRKIKCDELKPSCFNCSRLQKICQYPSSTQSNFKFEVPKQSKKVSRHTSENKSDDSESVSYNNRTFEEHNNNQYTHNIPQPQILPNSPSLNHRLLPPQQQQPQLSYRFYQENNSNIRTPPSLPSLNEPSSTTSRVNILDLGANRNDKSGDSVANNGLPQHLPIQTQPGLQAHSSHVQLDIQTPTSSFNTLNQPSHNQSQSIPNPILPHIQQPSQHLPHQQSECKKYKISDILSPDIDFLNDQNWGSIAPDDVRNLFDDASLLVHDSLEMFGIDQYNFMNQGIRNDQITNNHSTSINEINDQSYTTNGDTKIRNDSYPLSIPSSDETSLFPDFPIEEFSSRLFVKSNPIVIEPVKSNKELIDTTLKNFDLSGPHENYLNKLTNSELSFHMFPFASTIEDNSVNKILLKYSQGCSYLLTSLLSSSATFQFIQTRKSIHEQNRTKYNSICLKLLSEAFPQVNSEEEDQKIMANDIEKLLLTILVLTSNFTATAYFQTDIGDNHDTKKHDKTEPKPSKLLSWKTHLRGVKDLLLKYTNLTCNKLKRTYISDGLALAKTWYFAIEALAELNDPLGGTLKYTKKNISHECGLIKTDAELDYSLMSKLWLQTGYFSEDRNKDYHDALIRINLLTLPNSNSIQFNLYNGYSIHFVKLIDEFSKCLDLLRDHNNAQVSGQRISRIMSLIDKGRENCIAPLVNKETFIIPRESPGHPNYQKFDKVVLPKSCYGEEIILSGDNEESIYYSWFDWCEQMHVDSLYLKLLTTKGLLKLPSHHALIKELKIKILNSMFFIKPITSNNQLNHHHHKDKFYEIHDDIFVKSENFYISKKLFDLRVVMVQSVFRQCAKLSLNDEEFEKLELLFRGMIKLGNGSSLIALDQIRRLRNKTLFRIKKENHADNCNHVNERKNSNGSSKNGDAKENGSVDQQSRIEEEDEEEDLDDDEEDEDRNFLDIIPFS
ncbi:uncharacterized protein KGF55_000035 [Candida pseudojiufengensis]|uniref:uncharacterized protein n=1 Tax=Candida pseudojiufengensis TaxID=497109 RepID=UPI0022249B65|nr:uncharacterized protein KGF55_000035 [Candida pseudojiufengensis]KAI5968051.1 hypothetical protein KGF55_000035 [Candida pseudojiufengensis]